MQCNNLTLKLNLGYYFNLYVYIETEGIYVKNTKKVQFFTLFYATILVSISVAFLPQFCFQKIIEISTTKRKWQLKLGKTLKNQIPSNVNIALFFFLF